MHLPELHARITQAARQLPADAALQAQFITCALNTIETTTERLDDGTTFVFTGDIPALWLRDSSAQVRHYLLLAADLPEVQDLVAGLIRRQMDCILLDPYANAFNKGPTGGGHPGDLTDAQPMVWERKYEVDSLCYPLDLAWQFWKRSGVTSVFDDAWRSAVRTVAALFRAEQRHLEDSPYRFERPHVVQSDTLRNQGRGMPVNYTGMTWSGFRPSDDACEFGYLIPANMFAVVALRRTAEILRTVCQDAALATELESLAEEIDHGIQMYGTVLHPVYGKVYAYETDGFGNHNLMDDANVPSLLSIPYLGYAPADDPVVQATRRFVLSRDNPYFEQGSRAQGIGSPHTPPGYVWPIGLAMQGLTSTDQQERLALIAMLRDCDAGTGLMHESFHPDRPEEFTRPWFAWANTLFAELLIETYALGRAPQSIE